MKKATKAWLIAAAALIVTGCALFAGVMTTIGWNFTKLSTIKYETNVHEVDRPFSAIAVTTDTADVAFVLSDDGHCRVECREEENARHTVTVEGDTLTVKREDQRPWYDHVGISLGATKVTVYLPKMEYSALFVFENTGNVDVPQGLTFVDAEISVTTGDVRFFAAAQEKAKIKTSTGGHPGGEHLRRVARSFRDHGQGDALRRGLHGRRDRGRIDRQGGADRRFLPRSDLDRRDGQPVA